MECFYKDKSAERKIQKMEKIIKSKKFRESTIREIVARQKGELDVKSVYYDGNIAEGNWSLVENDKDIKILDRFDAEKEIFGKEHSERKKDAEYEYVFIPSYYAVRILILYYMKNPKQAEKVYGLKNAVVRHIGKKFYGGLPFILKYLGGDFKDDRVDFGNFIEELFDYERELVYDEENALLNDFIKDIIDCLNNFYGKDLILERRIRNFNESKDNWFIVDFCRNMDEEFILNYIPDYQILGHKDIEKDFKHLQKGQEKKAKEKIYKTPNHPNNDFPNDSEALRGDLSGWFSQRISKKDRLVYKKDAEKRIVYIATACSHYDQAPRRIKSTDSYKLIKK